jgi:hypothetical protein
MPGHNPESKHRSYNDDLVERLELDPILADFFLKRLLKCSHFSCKRIPTCICERNQLLEAVDPTKDSHKHIREQANEI